MWEKCLFVSFQNLSTKDQQKFKCIFKLKKKKKTVYSKIIGLKNYSFYEIIR